MRFGQNSGARLYVASYLYLNLSYEVYSASYRLTKHNVPVWDLKRMDKCHVDRRATHTIFHIQPFTKTPSHQIW